jgi:hypothetical protein
LAAWGVLGIIAAQGAMLLICAADPLPGWAGRPLPPEFWAMDRRWQFYLLMAILMLGPVATILVCRWKARGWWWLLIAWPVFLVVMLVYHERRITVMLRLIAEHW